MDCNQEIRNFVMPNFIVNKFHLKEIIDAEKPGYIKKSNIVLTNIEGNILHVDNLQQLRDVLLYFRAAGQICLQLLHKHMTIEKSVELKLKKKEEAKPRGNVETVDKGLDTQSFSHLRLPLEKMMPRKLFRRMGVQDLIGTAMFPPLPASFVPAGRNGPIFMSSNMTLRYGLHANVRPKFKARKYLVEVYKSEDLKKENYFYEQLLKEKKGASWKKIYKPLSNLFIRASKSGASEKSTRTQKSTTEQKPSRKLNAFKKNKSKGKCNSPETEDPSKVIVKIL